jgi:hypothetical protein
VEGRAARTVLVPAVPPAVGELTGQQRLGDVRAVLIEVRGVGERAAVDARLDLAFEVRLTGVVPPHVLSHPGDRARDGGVGGVDAERAQQL